MNVLLRCPALYVNPGDSVPGPGEVGLADEASLRKMCVAVQMARADGRLSSQEAQVELATLQAALDMAQHYVPLEIAPTRQQFKLRTRGELDRRQRRKVQRKARRMARKPKKRKRRK